MTDDEAEMIGVNGDVGVHVMDELCYTGFDGFGILAQWVLSLVTVFKRKCDIMRFICCRAIERLEHDLTLATIVL